MAGGFNDALGGAGAGAAIGAGFGPIGAGIGGALGGLGGWLFGSGGDDAKRDHYAQNQQRYAEFMPMLQDARVAQMHSAAAMLGPMQNMLMGIGSEPIPLPVGNPYGQNVGINPQGGLTGGGGAPPPMPGPVMPQNVPPPMGGQAQVPRR